jgi:ribokinase
MAPLTITIIGSLMVDQITVTDRLPDIGESLEAASFSRHLGGKGANAAIAAYRTSHTKPSSPSSTTTPTTIFTPITAHNDSFPAINGDHRPHFPLTPDSSSNPNDIRVCMIGAVGDDEYGPQFLSRLHENGVDTSGVRTVPGQFTGVSVAIVESDSGDNRLLYTTGANASLLPSDFLTLSSLSSPTTAPTKPSLLISQLEIRRETVEQILETCAREHIDTLLNAAPAKYLLSTLYRTITHLIVNEPEAAMLSGREMGEMSCMADWASVTDEFLQKGVRNVVVSLGAKGAYYSNAVGNGGYVEAERGVRVVDTTGAGYVFPVVVFVDSLGEALLICVCVAGIPSSVRMGSSTLGRSRWGNGISDRQWSARVRRLRVLSNNWVLRRLFPGLTRWIYLLLRGGSGVPALDIRWKG